MIAAPGPTRAQMAEADRLLLEDTGLRQVWDWLAVRFKDRHLTPDTGLRLDLGVDSIGWLDLALEVQRLCGVELDEKTIAGIETVRDLLRAVLTAPAAAHSLSWERPEEVLSARDLAWLRPHRGAIRGVHRLLLALNRLLMRTAFRLEVRGLEHLPAGPCVLAPNHVSFLDPFAVSAALTGARLERTCWGGWAGIAFGNPVTRALSRIGRVLPLRPEHGALGALALAAAALRQGDSLVWFPEGHRSANGRLLPLRPGLGLLMARFPLPVVPVHIAGAFEAMPLGRHWPRFLPLRVSFGPPLDPRPLIAAGEAEAPAHITEALAARLAAGQAPNFPAGVRVNMPRGPGFGRNRSYGDWPNAKDARPVPANASLVGDLAETWFGAAAEHFGHEVHGH